MTDPEQLNQVTAVFAGLALSSAAGLRVFLPLLALAIGMRLGYVNPGEQFGWLAHPMIILVLFVVSWLLVRMVKFFFRKMETPKLSEEGVAPA
mgnify:CR=1 FL=1